MDNPTNSQIYAYANLTPDEIKLMPSYIDGDLDFYGTTAYEKLYEYFAFTTSEMPYGTAKARTGDPDLWILDYLYDDISRWDLVSAVMKRIENE